MKLQQCKLCLQQYKANNNISQFKALKIYCTLMFYQLFIICIQKFNQFIHDYS